MIYVLLLIIALLGCHAYTCEVNYRRLLEEITLNYDASVCEITNDFREELRQEVELFNAQRKAHVEFITLLVQHLNPSVAFSVIRYLEKVTEGTNNNSEK